MKIHHLSIDEVFHYVGSQPEGLSTAEALRRLQKNGLNQVESAARKPVTNPPFLSKPANRNSGDNDRRRVLRDW